MSNCAFCKREIPMGASSICNECRILISTNYDSDPLHEKELKKGHQDIMTVVKFGLIYALMISVFSYFSLYEYSYFGFFEALIVMVLTRGVYYKSRLSAIILLLFFVATKAFSLLYGQRPGLVVALVYLIFFILFSEGIYGTHQYYKTGKNVIEKLKKYKKHR